MPSNDSLYTNDPSARDVYLVAPLRTPIGKLGGALAAVRPDDLLAHVFAQTVARAGVPAEAIDEVIAGCANQAGEDNRCVARMAWLIAGFPYDVPALTVNRLCASGLSAIHTAVRTIRAGDAELILAGGVESMSRAPYSLAKNATGRPTSGNVTAYDTALGWRYPNPRLEARFPLETMGETAENLVERYQITRADQDQVALRSHQLAVAAQTSGAFDAEIAPVTIPGKRGDELVARDEGPRADATYEALAKLAPAFKKGGTVTAGNSSTLNDGAAAMLVASEAAIARYHLTPIARVVAMAEAGVDPRVMGIGPVPATQKALARAGWRLSDVDLIELNEAFAAQSLAVARALAADPDRVNVRGGAIALGHPLGMSGARLLVTLSHALAQTGQRRGLAALCVGVGQGVATLIERP